jgi:hypothetical protein
MKHISQSQYEQLEQLYITEQFRKDNPKPNQMVGEYGWYEKKRNDFKEIMKKEGYTVDG